MTASAANLDIICYCYAPGSERQAKVTAQRLPTNIHLDDIERVLCELGFSAENELRRLYETEVPAGDVRYYRRDLARPTRPAVVLAHLMSAVHTCDVDSATFFVLPVNTSRTVQQQPTEGPRKTRRNKRKKRRSAYEQPAAGAGPSSTAAGEFDVRFDRGRSSPYRSHEATIPHTGDVRLTAADIACPSAYESAHLTCGDRTRTEHRNI
ncbi:hypothetical protein EVAR_59161_1 [Eumeta japonica]|uniref:Uncharacterized protein n=1 Tax=Eumeta variegata TaxID=151549 RepID=A0A4C1YYK1_EUMVA|nr:hypothetical protein EVAR_59161_1 [Eumeta japonica]